MPLEQFIALRGEGKVFISTTLILRNTEEELDYLIGLESHGHYVDLDKNSATVWSRKRE